MLTASKMTEEGSAPSEPLTIARPHARPRSRAALPQRPGTCHRRPGPPPARLHLAQGELADRRGLADTVHADEEPHRRSVAVREGKRLDIALEHRDEIVLKRLEESWGVGGGKVAAAQLRPKISEDPRRGRDTHVSEDERLLELLEGRFVDALAAADLIEVARQQASGASEPLPQHRATACAPMRRRGLRLRGGR